MNNTQLLIDAAKAAGYKLTPHPNSHKTPSLLFLMARNNWNPIESDADAFRLMVDCGIDVDFDEDAMLSLATDNKSRFVSAAAWEHHKNDKHAATRMAIVRAAAQSQEKLS